MTPILTRQEVREAYDRALALHPEAPESALVATAQALCLPVEAVTDCINETEEA